MSRIDEALRRSANEQISSRAAVDNELFVPAWTLEVSGQEPARAQAERALRSTVPLLVEAAPSALRGFSHQWRERLATGSQRDPVLVEQFRRLAATLHGAQLANGIRSVMVSSAAPEDGKTLTAVNLALVLSESYQRSVLLIDADLRHPSIGNLADVTGTPGLSDVLKAPQEQKLSIVALTDRLTLLPAGGPDPDPLAGLTSERMRRILAEATSRFDWVILDAPPIGPLADAGLLAQMTDGILFVIRAGRTHYSLVQKGIEALGRGRILGVVLNGVDPLTEPYEPYRQEFSRG